MTLPDNANVTLATMTGVDAGTYVIMAKTTVVQTATSGGAGPIAPTRCTLQGDPSTNVTTDDFAETELGRGDAAESGRATLQTTVTQTFASSGSSILLRCRRTNNSGSAKTAVARETKIVVIKVDTATRTAVTG